MDKPFSIPRRNKIREEQKPQKRNQIETLISDLKIRTTTCEPHPQFTTIKMQKSDKTPRTGITQIDPRKNFGKKKRISCINHNPKSENNTKNNTSPFSG
ncbi:hypothetical protein LR48_Vigan07g180900 [Vigna angularis]|nr:hypothetical protein LR48_Vigan07g180900 [Vigna angularis]